MIMRARRTCCEVHAFQTFWASGHIRSCSFPVRVCSRQLSWLLQKIHWASSPLRKIDVSQKVRAQGPWGDIMNKECAMLDAPGIQASRGFNLDAAGAIMQDSVRSWQLLQLKAVIAFRKDYNLKAHTVNFRSSFSFLPGCQLLKGVGWIMSSDELCLICTYSPRLPLHECRHSCPLPTVSMHASNFYPQVHTCPPP